MRNFLFILFVIITTNCSAYSISNRGKESIKKYESCQLTAYWDSNGYSIGYGHHGSDVYKGMKVSKSHANKLFIKDIESVNASINRLITALPVNHKFSQNFIDGLGDLIFNCGEAGVKKSDFYKRLMRCRKNNKQDLHFAIAAVKSLRISCSGHKTRRYNTHKLMLN